MPKIEKSTPVRWLVTVAVFTALSAILMYIEFPLPFIPPWLKLDISLVPAVIAGYALGPVAGIVVVLLKNVLHLFGSSSMFVGEIADILMGTTLVLFSSFISGRLSATKRMSPLGGSIVGAAVAVAAMSIVGMISNAYILWPAYMKIMGLDSLVAASADKAPWVTSLGSYVAYAVLPFNLIKGTLISAVSLLMLKPLAPLLRIRRETGRKKIA